MTEQGAIPFPLPSFLAYKMADISLRMRDRRLTPTCLAIHTHEMDRRTVYTRDQRDTGLRLLLK